MSIYWILRFQDDPSREYRIQNHHMNDQSVSISDTIPNTISKSEYVSAEYNRDVIKNRFSATI